MGGVELPLKRYCSRENKVYEARIKDRSGRTSFMIPLKCKKSKRKNLFAVSVNLTMEIIKWDGHSAEAHVVRDEIDFETGKYFSSNGFNEAKADPCGRFFGGTIRSSRCNKDSNVANASFYRYTPREGLTRLLTDVAISNGLDWDKKRKKFYYMDSCSFDIKVYDWDRKTGFICMFQRFC